MKYILLFLSFVLTSYSYAQTNNSCRTSTLLRLDVLHTQEMNTPSQWYTFTASSGNHYISLSSADTVDYIDSIVLYDGSCGRLNLLGSYTIPNNTGNSGTVALGALTPSAGYYVQVFGTSTGFEYSLNLFKTTASESCISPPPPCEHVCNGSFEDYTSLPTHLSQISKAVPWDAAVYGGPISSDYYHTNGFAYTSGPPFTPIAPYAGNGMAAILLLANYSREYIQQELEEPLKAGSTYYAEMYVRCDEYYSDLATDAIGMAFTSNQPIVSTAGNPIINPVGDIVSNPSGNIIQQGNWTQIAGFISPAVDRHFLTIGNFVPESSVLTSPVLWNNSPGNISWSYYLFDNISTVKIPEAGGTAHGCTQAQLGDSDCPGVAGMTYSWTGPGTFTPNANVLNPIVSQAGTYTLTVTYKGQSVTSNVTVTLGSCQAPFSDVFINETATDLINFYGSTPIANKDISLSGTTTIDRDLQLNGCNLHMGCDAKIVITNGNTLTLDGTIARSCDGINMWEGIVIEAGGKLIMDDSQVQDAKTGVTSQGGAEFDVSRCVFKNNIIGIDVLTYNNAHLATLDRTIFIIDNPLLAPYTNERTYGLRISDVGDFNGATSYNNFTNLHTGIGCYRSNMELSDNNMFDGLEMGIDARSQYTPNTSSTAYVKVVGPNTFKNSYVGVIAWNNVDLRVDLSTFEDLYAGISSRYNDGFLNLIVGGNTFNRVEYGVTSFYCSSQQTQIHNNTFTNGAGNAHAIFIQNVNTPVGDDGWTPNAPPKEGFLRIKGNSIDDYHQGIRIRNIHRPRIATNTITSIPAHSWENTYGINLHNCPNADVKTTTLKGTDKNVFESHGIRMDFCTNSDIRCNEIEDLGRAIWCGGQMPFTKVATNIMRNCGTGIRLNYGYIGDQVDAYYDLSASAPVAIPIPSDNAWDGTFVHHFFSYESLGHLSSFRIRSTGSAHYNALFNPAPWSSGFFPPNTATFITTYSLPNNNGELYSNAFLCPNISLKSLGETDEGLAELEVLDALAAENQLSAYAPDETEQAWLLQQALYSQTIEAPELVQKSAELQTFLSDAEQTSIDEIKHIAQLIQDFEEDGTLASLHKALAVNQAMGINNKVEYQYQDFYNIYLTELLEADGHFDFSGQQLADLREMAQQCPYLYGTSVYQARALLDMVEVPRVDYEHACESSTNAKANSNPQENTQQIEVQLWPNPASELLFIHIEHPSVADNDWEIRVFDITGAEITRYEKMNASHQWTIPVEKWNNGVYTLQMWQSGKMVTTRKLAIIH